MFTKKNVCFFLVYLTYVEEYTVRVRESNGTTLFRIWWRRQGYVNRILLYRQSEKHEVWHMSHFFFTIPFYCAVKLMETHPLNWKASNTFIWSLARSLAHSLTHSLIILKDTKTSFASDVTNIVHSPVRRRTCISPLRRNSRKLKYIIIWIFCREYYPLAARFINIFFLLGLTKCLRFI